jgi:adenosylcobinamide-GDP ribazoletransferase
VQDEIRRLLTAFQYFTRIPMPRWVGHDGAQLSGTLRYFPFVGIVVGTIAAACVWACAKAFSPTLAVLLSTAVTVVLTGAFHEDGLADTADGLGGGHTRERALEIMKDSRIGAFGALALILALSIKVTALAALPVVQAMVAMICAHALSRWCAVLLVWRLPYARTDSNTRARSAVEQMSFADLAIASVFGLAPSALALALAPGISHAIAGTLAAFVVCIGLGFWFRRRLGGYTGDTLGATQQLAELAFYLAWLATWNWS